MNTYPHASEILLNATRVSAGLTSETYEFVLDEQLTIIECVRIESLAEGIVLPIANYKHSLKGVLFELNHVRVNPRLDNTHLIQELSQALSDIGVGITNPPDHRSVAMCFKPLGEINDTVRFHFDVEGHVVFLTAAVRLQVIHNPQPPALPQKRLL